MCNERDPDSTGNGVTPSSDPGLDGDIEALQQHMHAVAREIDRLVKDPTRLARSLRDVEGQAVRLLTRVDQTQGPAAEEPAVVFVAGPKGEI